MKNTIQQFICVGAARSGTTRLWEWLNTHPSVHMTQIKETNYFTRDLIGRNGPGDLQALIDITQSKTLTSEKIHAAIVRDEKAYISLLSGGKDKICGEVSPSYLFYAKEAAARIHKFNSNCRIIILLREPVSRAFSQHALFTALKRESLCFRDALDQEDSRLQSGWEYAWAYKSLGLYYDGIKSYMEIFGREKIWVGLYDDLARSPQDTFDSICDFLGIPRHTVSSTERINQSPNSVGPLLRLSRTELGRIIKQITPPSLRNTIRMMETRSKSFIFERKKLSNREARRLKSAYSADVEKLNLIVPDLNIKVRWNY